MLSEEASCAMRSRRSRAFTLIELLVVIAIIGILAAMLFPVFARARESARKIQCLSNVKNIALAIQMYLTDYDQGFPTEHNQQALSFWDTTPGGGSYDTSAGSCEAAQSEATRGNPFLRVPVILDEYIKNRDVWRCPSARLTHPANFIVPDYGPGGFLAYYANHEGQWGQNIGGPCDGGVFPPGWGGATTDTILQGRNAMGPRGAAAEGMFDQSIAINLMGGDPNSGIANRKLSTVGDPSWFVACGDGGAQVEDMRVSEMVIPDLCVVGCASPYACWQPDWEGCSWSQDCGAHMDIRTDQVVFSRATRHLGGVNLGFMDGHAKWFMSRQILALAPKYACGCWGGGVVGGQLQGVYPGCPTTAGGDGGPAPKGQFAGTGWCGNVALY
jgi:prepilin-type N-terminal cleavage/methylation domain-containing protein/prepilin-type processing-associated H-X9-DG protein